MELIPAPNSEITISVPIDEIIYGDFTIRDIQQSAIDELSKEVLLARYSDKVISGLDKNFAGNKIRTFINQAVFTTGYKVDNLAEIIITTVRDIFVDFYYNTLQEVSLAFRLGARGQLGAFMGISVKTFYEWMSKYNTTLRVNALTSLSKIKKEQTKTVDPEVKKQFHIKWLNSFIADFENYKKGQQPQERDFGNFFYQYCIKNKIAEIDSELKKKLYTNAKQNIMAEYAQHKASTFGQRKDYKDIVESIQNNTMNPEIKTKVTSEAKRLAIPEIYKLVIERKLELKELIEKIEDTKL